MSTQNTMFNFLLILMIGLSLSFISCEVKQDDIIFGDQANQETLIPVRPGMPGEQPFWNGLARRFIQVPSFEIHEVEGAKSYNFSAHSETDGQTYTFISEKPWDLLSPIWLKLPVGTVNLTVEAVSEDGQVIGVAGTRKFYKAAPFNGPYQSPVVTYKESAKLALNALFNEDHIQHWLKTGEPDETYELNCYASKIIGAVVEGMLLYAGLDSGDSLEAMKIAKNAADYLISISETAEAPLAYFPPTYQGDALSAAWFKGQVMLNVPSEAARIYLDLFDVTGDKKYYEAATKIAETYLKLQLPNGTWKLKLYAESGEPVDPNESIPIDIVELFDRLINQYYLDQYEDSRDLALEWIEQNPLKTFNWEGQYEDIILQGPYQNMTKHQAGSYAIYLLDPERRDSKNIQVAKELVRFAEDQFVIWEKPLPDQSNSFNWLLPCVLEQYRFYEAVDASASKLIAAYQALYEATGEDLYLAKAISLANNMTVIQNRNEGIYSTWWRIVKDGPIEDWVNCAVYDARIMLQFGRYAETLDRKEKDLSKKNLLIILAHPATEENTAELINRYTKEERANEKYQLLRFIAQADIRAAHPLLIVGIQGPDEKMKAAAVSYLRYKNALTEFSLFNGVLDSKYTLVRHALLSSYNAVADKYLESGNDLVAREYYNQVLQKGPAFFDARHALKKLEEVGTSGSFYYIRPYLEKEGLSQFASTTLLKILLKYPEKLANEDLMDLLDVLTNSGDVEVVNQIIRWIQVHNPLPLKIFQKLSQEDGYLPSWWVAGPFPRENQQSNLVTYFPEKGIDLSQNEVFGSDKASWQYVRPLSIHGIIPFADLYGKREGIAYAYTELSLPDPGEFVMKVASNDGVACWVNNELVHSNLQIGRALKLNEDVFRVNLKTGKNTILLKVPNMGGNWEACLRIRDVYDKSIDLSPFSQQR